MSKKKRNKKDQEYYNLTRLDPNFNYWPRCVYNYPELKKLLEKEDKNGD